MDNNSDPDLFKKTLFYISEQRILEKLEIKKRKLEEEVELEMKRYASELKPRFSVRNAFLPFTEFSIGHQKHSENNYGIDCVLCFSKMGTLYLKTIISSDSNPNSSCKFSICNECALIAGTYVRCDAYNEMKRKCDLWDSYCINKN